ncbi:MAG TPA: RNA-binding cell elongation regulator Jag/EloR [Fimbriimonadaceae bacterium]|nr:RNA-binding cell elongation regulator Jag/EloR [Fimbriimonadaceae bacterium]
MNTLEITAATVDEAVTEAAKKLGVESADIDVTVLEETKGLFGKGKVRVKATVKESAAKAPEPKPAPAEKPATKAVVETVEKPKRAPRAKKKEEPKSEEPKAKEAKAESAKEEEPKDGEPEDDRPEVVATQADADELQGLLTDILKDADLDADIKVSEIQGRYVNLTLDGTDVSYLVGRRGEVINALQYLMNVISTRKLHNGVRVVLEGNDYRKKRQDVLTKLATQIAEEVAKRGEEAVLDALPAFERRVVHKALSEFPGVTTYSEGEEPNRRVVIAPAES